MEASSRFKADYDKPTHRKNAVVKQGFIKTLNYIAIEFWRAEKTALQKHFCGAWVYLRLL